jgi:hypothetical protein
MFRCFSAKNPSQVRTNRENKVRMNRENKYERIGRLAANKPLREGPAVPFAFNLIRKNRKIGGEEDVGWM